MAGRSAARGSLSPGKLRPSGFLLVVSGPSGVGKGTLVRGLLKARPGCRFSVSATTRPPRPGERNGREYWFQSREEFVANRRRGWFLEWARVHDHLYGTPIREVEKQTDAGRVIVLDVDVQGGASVRRRRPDAVSVFVAPPSLAELKRRLVGRRTESTDVIRTRLRNARREIPQYVHYDYLVVNDRLPEAIRQLVEIHDVERRRVQRLSR
ncbi:MAG TPA: guanylate kinase [Candidatus Acidoferrales bacterium]|nr:guanylate kinase [Candidatus Acidoferrales bacterium]